MTIPALNTRPPEASPWHSPSFDRAVTRRRLRWVLASILVGCSSYGFTIGFWRGAELGFYVAIKLPLLILLTVVCNSFINGIFAQLLQSGLGFRQTAQAILESFAIFSVILGSLSPVSMLLVWHLADLDAAKVSQAHAFLLVFHALVVAYAGLIANLRLLHGLYEVTRNATAAGENVLGLDFGQSVPWRTDWVCPASLRGHARTRGGLSA